MRRVAAPPTASSGDHVAWPTPPRARVVGILSGLLLLLISVIVIAGLFVSLYATDETGAFVGADTPYYAWRAELVAGQGLEALPESIPSPSNPRAWRVGHPLLAGFFHDLGGIRPSELIYGFPAVMATVVGLAGGAFALQGLTQPRWSFFVFAIATGASISMVVTSVGHADNLIVNGPVLATATAALVVADGRRGMAGSAVLVAGAALSHWAFTALFLGMLVVLAVTLLPESLRATRAGVPLLRTPSARLGLLSAGSAVVGASALGLAPAPPVRPAPGPRVFEKLRADGAAFAALGLPFLGGIAAVATGPDRARRRGLLLSLIWAGSAAVAVVAAIFVSRAPAHRLLPFALTIPILAAAGVVALARLLGRLRPLALGRAAAALVIATALIAGAAVARTGWRPAPATRADRLAEAMSAGRYLETVEDGRPVVFVIDPSGAGSPRKRMRVQFDVIRAGIPAAHILRTYAFLGDHRDLLEGRPTLRSGDALYNKISRDYWSSLEPVLEEDPIILALSSYVSWQQRQELGGTPVGAGLTVVRGPVPEERLAPGADVGPPPAGRMAAVAAIALLVLVGVGLGWSRSLLPVPWLEAVAMAPAFGVAVLVVGGAVGDRLGIGGPGSRWWLAAFLAVAGWVPFALRRLGPVRARSRAHRQPGASPE